MITNRKPDRQKSDALKKMAEVTLERLKKTDAEKYPSNTLLDYYDTIHKLMDALALRNGVTIKGEGAHRELIDHISKEHMNEQTRQFLQNMMEHRNRISYEGFMIQTDYIIANRDRIQNIIKTLFSLLK